MEISLAICTYRRLDPLRETLESLVACHAPQPPCAWELIVVDNEGNEQVRRLVESFHDRLPVRYVHEANLGTSHARNRAVREAKAPIVLFTDDDVTFDQHWLQRMVKSIREQAQCGFWGGRVEPVFASPAPKWFDPDRCAMLGDTIVQYRQGDQPRYWSMTDDPPFYTANLALRVDAVQRAGYFDTNVGHRGGVRMGMEDSLMVRAIASLGERGWYCADATVFHPVPAERMTRKYARRFAWRQGWLSVQISRRASGSGDQPTDRLPPWFYRVAMEKMLGGMRDWLAGLITFNTAKAFAGQFVAVFNGSKLWHAIRT